MKKENVKKAFGISIYLVTALGSSMLITGVGNSLINGSTLSKGYKILTKIGLFGLSSKVSNDVGEYMQDVTEALFDSVHIVHEKEIDETETKSAEV